MKAEYAILKEMDAKMDEQDAIPKEREAQFDTVAAMLKEMEANLKEMDAQIDAEEKEKEEQADEQEMDAILKEIDATKKFAKQVRFLSPYTLTLVCTGSDLCAVFEKAEAALQQECLDPLAIDDVFLPETASLILSAASVSDSVLERERIPLYIGILHKCASESSLEEQLAEQLEATATQQRWDVEASQQ